MGIELTKKELATVAGYSYRRLHDINVGLPEGKKIFELGEGGKYDLAIFVQRWVAYNLEKGAEESVSLEKSKAIHEQVKIEKTRLEVAHMRGELVDVNAVTRLWANVATTVVQNMMRLPNKIAPQVFMVDNPDIVSGIIDKEIREVLNNIADTPLPDEAVFEREEEETSEEE